ncbi:hypothetical protein Lalb_Chr14g0362411 [Lupinus albus]|uniref:Transmembrane protein TauE n=1 Tax=Lupinus albus TaxID=3870 RepID=A0A6A4P0T6_LUPAL|nr:hypothetical protein Lalb_Chr14g0362411 [Lupinus albus]
MSSIRMMTMMVMMMIMIYFGSRFVIVSGDRGGILMKVAGENMLNEKQIHESSFLTRAVDFLWQPGDSDYHHIWPDMVFGWQIVCGTIIGFCGAAFGSVGGVGGGGIFVPTLTLVVGFDPKSATALSKCKSLQFLAYSVSIYSCEKMIQKIVKENK